MSLTKTMLTSKDMQFASSKRHHHDCVWIGISGAFHSQPPDRNCTKTATYSRMKPKTACMSIEFHNRHLLWESWDDQRSGPTCFKYKIDKWIVILNAHHAQPDWSCDVGWREDVTLMTWKAQLFPAIHKSSQIYQVELRWTLTINPSAVFCIIFHAGSVYCLKCCLLSLKQKSLFGGTLSLANLLTLINLKCYRLQCLTKKSFQSLLPASFICQLGLPLEVLSWKQKLLVTCEYLCVSTRQVKPKEMKEEYLVSTRFQYIRPLAVRQPW